MPYYTLKIGLNDEQKSKFNTRFAYAVRNSKDQVVIANFEEEKLKYFFEFPNDLTAIKHLIRQSYNYSKVEPAWYRIQRFNTMQNYVMDGFVYEVAYWKP